MTTTGLVAVVCEDRAALRGAVVRLLRDAGMRVAAVTDSFPAVRGLVQQHAADLAVVAVSLTGLAGLEGVRRLRQAAPSCEVVLLSEPGGLTAAAVAAGALALVPEDDLRAVRRLVGQLPARTAGTAAGSSSTNPSS